MENKISVFDEIIKAINSPKMDIDRVLHIIMKHISQLINAEAWSLLLLDKERKELIFKEVTGKKSKELSGKRMPMTKGIVGWVVKNKKPLIVIHPYKDKRFFDDIDRTIGFKTRDILAIPLISKGNILGVIEAINKKGEENFTKSDLKSISNYVAHAAIALENANLVKRLQDKVRYLTLLSDINKNITSILDLGTLLEKSTHLIQKTFGYYYVAIGIIEGSKAILKGFAAQKNIKPFRTSIKEGEGLVGKAIQTRKRIIVLDTEQNPEYYTGIKGIASEMVIPIKKEKDFSGIIDIGSPKKYAFTEEEANIIEEVSHQLAIALENARLYQKIRLASITDELTGLYNSRYCNEKLPAIVEKWHKKDKECSLIFMDLDYFKRVNDTYNHLIGSKLLHLVANRIKKSLNDKMVGIRYGGDEYIIVIEDANLSETIEFARKIKKLISSKPFKIEKKVKYSINASFGIASFPDVADNFYELLRLADLAMYYVKAHGRNRIAFMTQNADVTMIDE
ncbi:diguanylate cyclase [candidate division WOR-3 bacterium]|nr:diguanylate cyclase [candidate division WOR-3 bacterium]MCK4527674.1 diguanylate cyclase [candidate division WOR-3 bacterium]